MISPAPGASFAAALLAGGKSVRMGTDKALIRWMGDDLWRHQLTKVVELEPSRVLLSCRAEQGLLPGPGVDLLLDPVDVDEGPLGAIVRCLRAVEKPLLVLAVDLPAMTAEFLRERLLTGFDGSKGLVFRTSQGLEPLAALYTPAVLPLLEEALAAGKLGLQDVIGKAVEAGLMSVVQVRWQEQTYFRNANTPEDLTRIADDAFATPVQIRRVQRNAEAVIQEDVVAREEPLEIRVEGRSVAVVMRTPGHDRELAAGFLVSEGVVQRARDILEISQCPSTGNKKGNVVEVLLGGAVVNWDSLTRHVFSASSCGLCGKTSIDSVFQQFAPVTADWRIAPDLLWTLADKLKATQATFSKTGGLHACALFDLAGNLVAAREDVGRHNALDKVLGHGLLNNLLPFNNHVLFLSGRISFEMMQKALAGGVPLVAAISAPSSLAVEFAEESNQTLVGFVREPTLNVYAHGRRLTA
ncbi:MAG: Sulfur carrier protein FdhD [Verrucomicrobiaceae bacterium]|nr:Sulfur carrier protein FdhD [Verrucomicrobiaceae bacterium]